MEVSRLWAILVMLVTLAFGGCRSSWDVQAESISDLLQVGTVSQIGMRLYIDVTLRPGVDPAAADCALAARLRNESGALPWGWLDGSGDGYEPFRPRVVAAILLADLRGIEFPIRSLEAPENFEARVSKRLLR